jgi:uncharacterized protein (DUF1800 family)
MAQQDAVAEMPFDSLAANTEHPTAKTAPAAPVWGLLGATLALAACGGGGESASPAPAPAPSTGPLSREQSARFLSQASFGGNAADIERLRTLGTGAWLDEQMALPRSSTYVDWLKSKGYDALDFKNSQAGSSNMLWRKLIGSPDVLRQRVSLALSEVVVISISNVVTPFKSFASGAFMDIVEANALGNYRTLLEQVSTSPAMGAYLSFRGNQKANATTGSQPDENYAREVMQLFSIGLVNLNQDGTPQLASGKPVETYTQADVSQMARVFTGWDLDTSVGTADTPDRVTRPMVQIASRHELGTKAFLGTTIAANTNGAQSLQLALNTLMAHPNMAPFISRQLIQRLVTSNPMPAYVARVAAVFNNNGSGVKGDMKAVLRAILLDTEARSDSNLNNANFGKLREPLVRFIQWARTFGLTSPDDSWNIGDLSDPATKLGQSPLRAPSVFNFFRPGYVPPNSSLGTAGITAPEFQITTESSVAGYVNFMQGAVSNGVGGLKANYSALLPLVGDSAALLAELNVLLAAGQLSAATLASLKTALDSISSSTATGQTNRLYAALTLVMAAPEYIAQK